MADWGLNTKKIAADGPTIWEAHNIFEPSRENRENGSPSESLKIQTLANQSQILETQLEQGVSKAEKSIKTPPSQIESGHSSKKMLVVVPHRKVQVDIPYLSHRLMVFLS